MFERTVVRLTIGMGVPIACALIMEQLPKTGVAEVPFAFQVEQQILPPGTYSVKQADLGRAVSIQNEKVGQPGMLCQALKRRFGTAQEARLVFHSHAGRYFLSEIWFDADGRGLILPEDREAQRDAPSSPDARAIKYISFR